MKIENVERIAKILNSDDFTMGLRWTKDGTRLLIDGGGDEAALTVKAAKVILGAMQRDWGENSIHTRVFSGLIKDAEAR